MAAEKPTTSLAVVEPQTMFPVLAYDPTELQELIEENLGGQMPRLTRIPWPTGGNLQFVMETDEGAKRYDKIEGLIVHHTPNRTFWIDSFEESGGGQRADCSSSDGVMGVGKPEDPKTGLVHPMFKANPNAESFPCKSCPLAKFRGDDRPRCRETHPLFIILRAESDDDINLLPIIVSVPPSSLQVWSNFSGQLLTKGISYRKAIVEITLEQDKGGPKGTIAYSKMVVRRSGMLSNGELAFMKKYAASLEPLFERFRDRAVDDTLTETGEWIDGDTAEVPA